MTILYEFIAGVVIPNVIYLLDKYFPKNPKLKYISILAICFLAGLSITLYENKFDSANVFGSFIMIATTAQAIYALALKKPAEVLPAQ